MEQCKITYYLQCMRKEDYFSLCLSNAVESISKVTRYYVGLEGARLACPNLLQSLNSIAMCKEGCCQLRITTIYCKMYKLSGNLCCCIMDNNFIHLQLILLIVKCSKSPGISTYTQIHPLFSFPRITNFPHTQYEGTSVCALQTTTSHRQLCSTFPSLLHHLVASSPSYITKDV